MKPRFASTSDQSEIVLGVPGTAVAVAVGVGVLPAVVVEVVDGVALAVAVTPGLGLTVAVVDGVATAPSSRKSIDGFAHQ